MFIYCFLQYYIEPGTGKRFRSLVAVERYLTEENEHTPLQALVPANKYTVGCVAITDLTKVYLVLHNP